MFTTFLTPETKTSADMNYDGRRAGGGGRRAELSSARQGPDAGINQSILPARKGSIANFLLEKWLSDRLSD